MDSKILFGKILQRFADRKVAKVSGYNEFGDLKETDSQVYVSREGGQDTPVPFTKILLGIEVYQNDPDLYDLGPSALRDFGITHVTSPAWSMLHLLEKEEHQKPIKERSS